MKFFVAFLILIMLSGVAYSFNKYYLEMDYDLYVQTECDPSLESCFVYVDEEAGEEFPYKLIFIKAYAAPECTGTDCPPVECPEGTPYCRVALCDEAIREDFAIADECSLPEMNP